MNINSANTSTSSYVNKASSNKGVSGLASNMDTESLVEAMLSGTQSKIDKQTGLKQQMLWKQEIYRDIITQINTFQSKYFGRSSGASLMNESFWNAMSAAASSSAFRVNATSSATSGNTSLEVRRLATNTSVTSGAGVSGKLAGNFSADAFNGMLDAKVNGDYTVKIRVGDEDVSVDLKDVFVENGAFKDYADGGDLRDERVLAEAQEKQAKALADKLNEALAGKGVTAQAKNGQFTLTGADPSKPVVVLGDSGSEALSALGLTGETRAQLNSGKTAVTLSAKLALAPTVEFAVSLDGMEKTISLDMRGITGSDGRVDLDKLRTEFQKRLDDAHGKDEIKLEMDASGGFELRVSSGRKVMIGGDKATLAAMGVKNGQSNRIGLGGSLKDLFFSEPLQGRSFGFSINGRQFSFTENDTIGDVLTEVNRSGAGVRIVYRAQDDTFTMEATDSGAGRGITMSQSEGNLLNAMFGSGFDGSLAGGTKTTSGQLGRTTLPPTGKQYLDNVKGGTFQMTVDGDSYTLTVKKRDTAYTQDELIDALNAQLEEQFGAGQLEFVKNADGATELKVHNGAAVKIPSLGTIPEDPVMDAECERIVQAGALSVALGFGVGGTDNYAAGSDTLASVGLTGLVDENGNPLDPETTTLDDLANLTANLSFEDGRVVLTGNGAAVTAGSEADMVRLFGSKTLSMGQVSGRKAEIVHGQNALVKIDGLLTERSSNSFSVNGLNIDLRATTGSYIDGTVETADGTPLVLADGQYIEDGWLYGADGNRVVGPGGDAVHYTNLVYRDAAGNAVSAAGIRDGKLFIGTAETIETTRDTDQIVEGVKGFIEDYNKLLEKLNGLLDEDTNYKKYAPLTEDQKKEMSEKQVELWEEKSKEGLLRRDSTIDGFLQEMRTALYTKPAGSDYALYNLGIETGEWEGKGQLVLSADGEATLRQMLEGNSDAILKLFTDPEDGLGAKLNDIIDRTAKISVGSPGSLVQMAGVKGKSSENSNTIYERLKEIDNRIAALQRTYEKEKTRYWNQFNAMEQAISNLNSQSSWLTQQLGA